MHLSDFDYNLPPELIAREPIRPRDASRMMVLDARTGDRTDSWFRELPNFLRQSDVLVLNDTRVIRSRLHGTLSRQSGTTREMEVFFTEAVSERRWRVLCRPARRIRLGDEIIFSDQARGIFRKIGDEDGLHELEVTVGPFAAVLERYGKIPLPPYLGRSEEPSDAVDYQTVFAAKPGAVAAPTAGLHFTPEVLRALAERGVEILYITLHVGIGTFLPIRTDDPRQHVLRAEQFEMSEQTAARLRAAQAEGRRIISVGTTTTRTLEYVIKHFGEFRETKGAADLFILPGHKFLAVNALITNFHLPRSTLLMLVSAFAGRDAILAAYEHAVTKRYRFYSYGDCMLISR